MMTGCVVANYGDKFYLLGKIFRNVLLSLHKVVPVLFEVSGILFKNVLA